MRTLHRRFTGSIGGSKRPHMSRSGTAVIVSVLLALGSVLSLATSAVGQTTDELKADAYDAARTAAAAREQAAAATQRLKVAEEEAARAAAAVTAAERDGLGTSVVDRAVTEEVRKEAQIAHQKANEALAAVKELQQRLAWDRSGAYLGGAVFWAPELFDTDFRVDASRGFAGWLGYRFTPRLALEVRAARIDDFDLSGFGLTGSLDGWEFTGNAKIYLFTRRVQPYLTIGAGSFASRLELEAVETGERFSDRHRDFVVRSGIGIDCYLTTNLVFALEATYSAVGGQLDAVRFGQLGGGLTYRF